MPTVTVRHFAQLREQRGVESESIDVPTGTSMEGLYHLLFPDHVQSGLAVGYALNHTVVEPGAQIEEGDEVAFLPPIGGG